MNFVFLSPHFPPNYYQFCVHLRDLGATVLGLGDEPFDNLRPELKNALNEYYWVPNMHNYDDLVRALGYFTFHYGRVDGLDSHNEYWLETEARLRTDFNIEGIQVKDLPPIKRKSLMKARFKAAGVATAPGIVIHSVEDAHQFVGEHGFPVIAKPDIGVGAAKTYKFEDMAELDAFLDPLPPVEYFLEKYVSGQIQTFDGLTDHNGDVVFLNSLVFNQGIMEAVNEDTEIYYYTQRVIPPDLERAGRRVVKEYDICKRFFHIEFFRTPEDKLIGLEVNMRPPGGLTTDMFNFANDIDVYYEWANIILHNKFSSPYSRPYHCAYIGRKWNRNYRHSHDEVMARFGARIVHFEEISGVFSAALGNFGYLARSPDMKEILAIAEYLLEKS
jgi:hypothetical protein